MTENKRFSKTFIQDCVVFIGAMMGIISIPLFIVSYTWTQTIGFILFVSGFVLVIGAIFHMMIFGDVD